MNIPTRDLEFPVRTWRVQLEHLPSGQVVDNRYRARFPNEAVRLAKEAAVDQLGHSRWAYGLVRCDEVDR